MTNYTSTFVPMSTCKHCGNIHTGQCPRVKAIEYHKNGKVKRVEYFDMQPAMGVPFMPDSALMWKTGTTIDKPTAEWLTFTHGVLSRDWLSVEDCEAWDGKP